MMANRAFWAQFPQVHLDAMAGARPGAIVTTDISGTRVTLPRTFVPTPVLADRSPANLISVTEGAPFSGLYTAGYARPTEKIIHRGVVVIKIDGACSGNGTPSAKAGVGVYFGPGSVHNLSERLLEGPQTNQRAEIRAAIRALEIARAALAGNFSISTLVLVCDSQYVVKAMTDWVYGWKQNGWKGSGGKKIVNEKDLKALDGLIEECEEDGLAVEFWAVPRSDNVEADSLAVAACQ